MLDFEPGRCCFNPLRWPKFYKTTKTTKWIIRQALNQTTCVFAKLIDEVRSKIYKCKKDKWPASAKDSYRLVGSHQLKVKCFVLLLILLPKGSVKYVSNDIEYRTTEISFKNIAFMVPPLTGTAGYDYTSNDLKNTR